MNPGRFYIPQYMNSGFRTTMFPITNLRNNAIISPMINLPNNIPKNIGIFSKITNGIRTFNWSGLLNGANKTLNVVNQTIPLVRQAGPMVNNMKNMLRIAKAFGNETTINQRKSKQTNINNTVINSNKSTNYHNTENYPQKKEAIDDNYPNFFI